MCGKGSTVFHNGVFNRRNREHVVKGLDRGGTKSAADASNSNILGHLEDVDMGFR